MGKTTHKIRARRKRQERRQKNQRVGQGFVADVIRETVGWAPYEKRMMEFLRSGNPKKALKFCRKRLGSHQKAKKKKAFLEAFQQQEAKKAQMAAKKRREAEAKAALAQQKAEAERKEKKKAAA